MDKDKMTYIPFNPLQNAIEMEIARCSEEGFISSAKSLNAALQLIKKAEADEYNEWRLEQGIVKGFN